jgi:hypothetical protein
MQNGGTEGAPRGDGPSLKKKELIYPGRSVLLLMVLVPRYGCHSCRTREIVFVYIFINFSRIAVSLLTTILVQNLVRHNGNIVLNLVSGY